MIVPLIIIIIILSLFAIASITNKKSFEQSDGKYFLKSFALGKRVKIILGLVGMTILGFVGIKNTEFANQLSRITFKKKKEESKHYETFQYPDRVFELNPGQSVEVMFESNRNYDFISKEPMEVSYKDSIANVPRFIFIARDGKRYKRDNIEEFPQSFKTIGNRLRIIKNIGKTTDILTLASSRPGFVSNK